ncbi:MAG TPA: hypothetical protein VHF27_05320 [Acidimicrobiales bacterium]|nr:hypothetical protein [Acidimicrobiales bacterium]
MTLALSIVAWMLIGILAAWLGKTLAADHLGWLWFGVLGVAGAVIGGTVGLAVAEEFYAGIAGSTVGGLFGALVRGAAAEIKSRTPGLTV